MKKEKFNNIKDSYLSAMNNYFTKPLFATFISLPKLEDLIKEYDSLSRRQYKKRKKLEHDIFWVSYQQFKYNNKKSSKNK